MRAEMQHATNPRTNHPSHIHRWRGALLLVFIQAAPLTVPQDSSGKLSLGIGFGAIEYRQILSSCTAPGGSRDINIQALTGLIDYLFPSDKARISVFAGVVDADVGPISGSARFRNPPDGFFLGALGGYDSPTGAAQLGMLLMPDDSAGTKLYPSVHTRIGSRTRFHLRADLFTVRSPGQLPSSAVGLEIGSALAHTTSIFAGIAQLPLADVGHQRRAQTTAAFAEGSLRISDAIMLTGGTMGADDGVSAWHAGLRLNSPLGGRPSRR